MTSDLHRLWQKRVTAWHLRIQAGWPVPPVGPSLRQLVLCTLLIGVGLSGTAPSYAQSTDVSPTATTDVEPLFQLKLPKAQAAAFFKAWTQAHAAMEQGKTAESRAEFARVLGMLDELEATPSQRERAILTKATLHAQVLHDRFSAKREVARALELNPKSKRGLELDARLKAEEQPLARAPDSTAPKIELAPRVFGSKEGTP